VPEFSRYGVILNGKEVPYRQLIARYVCAACGGGLLYSLRYDLDRHEVCGTARCAECGGQEFIHEYKFVRQVQEGAEVLAGLPEGLRALAEKGGSHATEG